MGLIGFGMSSVDSVKKESVAADTSGNAIAVAGLGYPLCDVVLPCFNTSMFGMTIVKSSAALVGLCGCSTRWSSDELAPFTPSFLALPLTELVAAVSIFLAATLLLAVLAAGAGALGFPLIGATPGLTHGFSIFCNLRVANGSAVAGRGRSVRRGFIGRTGAEDNEPVWTVDVVAIEAFLEAADTAVPDLLEVEEVRGLTGRKDFWADPGRSGKSFPAILARFCAAMVSFNEGLEVVVRGSGAALLIVAVVDAEAVLGFGFAESFRSSSCCFGSRADVILALRQRNTS